LQDHTNLVNCVAVTNDNKFIVSCSDDKSVRLWDFITKKQETLLLGHTDAVKSVTTNNLYIISGSWDNTIRL
jgi:FOG: WD40 repeat